MAWEAPGPVVAWRTTSLVDITLTIAGARTFPPAGLREWAVAGTRLLLARARERVGKCVVGRWCRRLRCACPGPATTRGARITWRGVAACIGARLTRSGCIVESPGQRDALACDIYLQHLHLDDVAGLHHFARILHVAVRQRRDVHQSILVHADVDEGTERGDVADHAFEDHA